MLYCIYKPLTEKFLSCYRIKGFSSLLVCSAFIFCCAITSICYIRVDFTFGLLDCIHYNEDFVISRFVKSRFCSTHFTAILAGLTLLYRGSLNRGSTVVNDTISVGEQFQGGWFGPVGSGIMVWPFQDRRNLSHQVMSQWASRFIW